MQDPHLNVPEETGVAQARVFPGGLNRLAIPREDLLDDAAIAGLDLRERDVRGHQIDKYRGAQGNAGRRRTVAVTGLGGPVSGQGLPPALTDSRWFR
jgi:hypothetical protein